MSEIRERMATSDQVLEFWFGKNPDDPQGLEDRVKQWFTRADAYDQQVRTALGDDAERAARGELDGWAKTPRGLLALVLLLDQVRRNLNRDSAEAYAQDGKTQKLVIDGLSRGDEKSLSFVERVFFYMPLQHSEKVEHQRWSVQRYEKLYGDAPPQLKEFMRGALEFARRHHYVVEKFGRFPHRNRSLGRPSTREEEDFLAKTPQGF